MYLEQELSMKSLWWILSKETIAQHVIWNLIVIQMKGEFKFI